MCMHSYFRSLSQPQFLLPGSLPYNIILRCNVVAALRKAMTEHGFLEITTPILTVSSPEGARDYLVPARKHPGKFYALPQAPQQFKQLLMTSGFDRYFQIAPCFRDEDARGDRSPGEFYQLDMEMAFAAQDDVFAVIEDVLPPIFAKFGKYNIASEAPFRRIAYNDALETYGSDKPDLRIDLVLQDMTELVKGIDFAPFAEGNAVKAIVVDNCELARKAVDKLVAETEVISGTKPMWFKLGADGELSGGIAKFLTDKTAEITAAIGLKPGCFVGVTLGRFIPERFNSAIEKGIALCVFYIGLDGVLAGSDTLVAILSMVLGVILGELLEHLAGAIAEPGFPHIEYAADQRDHRIGWGGNINFIFSDNSALDAETVGEFLLREVKRIAQLFDTTANGHRQHLLSRTL